MKNTSVTLIPHFLYISTGNKKVFFFFNLIQTEEETLIAHQKVRQSLTAPEHCCIVHGKLLSASLNFFPGYAFPDQAKPFHTGLSDRSRRPQSLCPSHKWNGITFLRRTTSNALHLPHMATTSCSSRFVFVCGGKFHFIRLARRR